MAAIPPRSDAPAAKPQERVRSFLGWAFVISIAIHLALAPLLQYKPPQGEKEEVEKVSVSKRIVVATPKPTPPPTPTPPPVKATPPPVKATNPPPVPKLKLNVPKTTAKSNESSAENKYVAPAVGNENGVPQGNAATGAPGPVATPGSPATPSPTPKPACAQPHVDAIVTRAADPEYPELARQQGVTGVTQVRVTLTETGGVSDAEVYKSSGNPLLDRAAVTAAKESSYSPEIDNCVKVSGSYLFRAEFAGQ
jgi:protein TonB